MFAGVLAGCTDEGGNGGDDPEDDPDTDDEMDSPEEDETEGLGDNEETEDEEEEEDMDGEAMVRVAHLSPDAPNVDVYVDDEAILEDVPYLDVSEYLELAPDTYTVTVTAAGDEETVAFEDDVEVAEGEFTLAAVGELEGENQPFDVLVLEDDFSDPGEDARVRVLHASPDAPEVDLADAESGDLLVEGAAFGDDVSFEVPEGTYTLEARPAGEEEAVAEFDVDVVAGEVYSAFVVGYLEPEDAPIDEELALEVVEDTE